MTRQRGLTVAEARAKNVNLADRIDIFEIEQFIALNFYELGKFVIVGRRVALTEFVTRYNEIIDKVETDPSLRELADLPLGWWAKRAGPGEPWIRHQGEPEGKE